MCYVVESGWAVGEIQEAGYKNVEEDLNFETEITEF